MAAVDQSGSLELARAVPNRLPRGEPLQPGPNLGARPIGRESEHPTGLVTSSFLLLVVMPGATSSVLAPSSDALCYW